MCCTDTWTHRHLHLLGQNRTEQILKCPLLTYAGRRVGLVLVTRSRSVIVCVPGAVIVAPGVALAPAAPGAALAVVTLEATNSLALVLPPFK